MTITIERILCPVDLSEFSRGALRHAAALAGWYNADVIALTVRPAVLQPAGADAEYPVPIPLEPREDRERMAEAMESFVKEVLGSRPVQTLMKDGGIVSEIVRTASELPADLIVMGTHGLGGFERFILGSVTEKVLRKAPCPVLTVPPPAATAEPGVVFGTIVCGVDFSEASTRALQFALSLAQQAGGRLILVHVLESFTGEEPRITTHFNLPEFRRAVEQEATARLAALVPAEARTWCEPDLVLGHGKAYRELLRVSWERRADLIVLGVHGRSAVDLMLFGSTAQHTVRRATCPILTVPGPADQASRAPAG